MKTLPELLNAYTPTLEEIPFKEEMLDFYKSHSNAFERACLTGHFTASAWLLDKTGERALLMHHRKLDRWMQTGGHCDGDQDCLAVAIKEAQEESGIQGIIPVSEKVFDIDIHEIPEYKRVPAHKHLDLRFILKVNSDEELVQNSESKALAWFHKGEKNLPTTERSVLRMWEKWQKL